MRIGEDLRQSVVFFGYRDDTPGKGGIACIGTGFLVGYEEEGYLVTARHLAHQLGGDPFLLRLNRNDGSAENLHVDGLRWFHHPDPTVDLSAIPLRITAKSNYHAVYIRQEMIATDDIMARQNIGVGNQTYTIGLFRLLYGEKRNLPVLHRGSIAMMPGEERIPVRAWDKPGPQERVFVEGYLIECQGLSGLSGSPVFVRSEVNLNTGPLIVENDGTHPLLTISRASLSLLGVWQGSWEAKPDEVLSAQLGASAAVPVGMGIVVPSTKLIELLKTPELQALRDSVAPPTTAATSTAAVARSADKAN